MAEAFLLKASPENLAWSLTDMKRKDEARSEALRGKPANWMIWGVNERARWVLEQIEGRQVFIYVTKDAEKGVEGGLALYGVARGKVALAEKYWPRGEGWLPFYLEVVAAALGVLEKSEDPRAWKLIPREELLRAEVRVLPGPQKLKPEQAQALKELLFARGQRASPSASVSSQLLFGLSPKIELMCRIALASGKNLLLVGAPGVGKTRLALELAGGEERLPGFEVVTCREGLTYDKLVAYYTIVGDSPRLELGPLTKSVALAWLSLALGRRPGWLVLDEVNRVNIDVVLGEIFTAMDIEHRMELSIVREDLLWEVENYLDSAVNALAREGLDEEKIQEAAEDLADKFEERRKMPMPYAYRLLATMNVYDRAQLYRLGYAFLRRFAQIYIPPPYEEYKVETGKSPPEDGSEIVYQLLIGEKKGVVEQAVRELTMHKYRESLVEYDNPIPPEFLLEDAETDVAKLDSAALVRSGLCERGFRLVAKVYSEAEQMEVELGLSPLVDCVKFCIVGNLLLRGSGLLSDAEFADFILSSLVLPQLGVLAPRIRAEKLIGEEATSRRVRALLELVEETLGKGSLSYRVLRGLGQFL
ncbi:MAG: AAA family ATPase [Thermofilum sp.]|nr:AAA family ATPase [Thermofilum sp.]